MFNMATRWAICGTGKIANDFCACLKCLPSTEHQIVAVAAGSSKKKAEEFAAKFDIPESYGSYDQMLGKDNIDVVYVNAIHTLHVETCLKFINDGKSVLCEKPMALTLEGCRKVLKAAKEKGVLFVEGIWSRFYPAYTFIKEQIDAGSIGEVKMVQVNTCAPISDIPRIKEKSLGGGGLLDIGIYVIEAAYNIFNGEKPEHVWTDGVVCSENGVDTSGVIILRYSKGRFASLHYSTETQPDNNSMTVRGTKGTIEFWSPTKVVINGEVKEFPVPECKPYTFNFFKSQGLTYEAQGVRHCLLNGLTESPNILHAHSESIMGIMQQMLDKMGIKYDAP